VASRISTSDSEHACIAEHEGFHPVSLNIWVLQTWVLQTWVLQTWVLQTNLKAGGGKGKVLFRF